LLDAGVDDDADDDADDDEDARADPDDPDDDPLACGAEDALEDLDIEELDEPVAPGEALEHAKRSVDSVAA